MPATLSSPESIRLHIEVRRIRRTWRCRARRGWRGECEAVHVRHLQVESDDFERFARLAATEAAASASGAPATARKSSARVDIARIRRFVALSSTMRTRLPREDAGLSSLGGWRRVPKRRGEPKRAMPTPGTLDADLGRPST